MLSHIEAVVTGEGQDADCLTEFDVAYYNHDTSSHFLPPEEHDCYECCRAACKSKGDPYFTLNGEQWCGCKSSNADRREIPGEGRVAGSTCL